MDEAKILLQNDACMIIKDGMGEVYVKSGNAMICFSQEEFVRYAESIGAGLAMLKEQPKPKRSRPHFLAVVKGSP